MDEGRALWFRLLSLAAGGVLLAAVAAPAAAADPSDEPESGAVGTEEGSLEQRSADDALAESVEVPSGDTDVIAYGEPTPDGLVIMASFGGSDLEPVASLFIGGMDTSMWSGTTCVTGSGRYLAASFAPVEMANDPLLLDQGAFLAVVDLEDLAVRMVPERVAFKYHTPGCGPDDEITALRHLGRTDDSESTDTELLRIDPDAGQVSEAVTVGGHLTSPAPVGDVTYASTDFAAVSVDFDGAVETVVEAEAQVVDLHANEAGGLDYLLATSDTVEAHRVAAGASASQVGEPMATAPLGDLRWAPGQGGDNRLVGQPEDSVADEIELVEAEQIPDAVSLEGEITVASASVADDADLETEAAEVEVTDVAEGETETTTVSLAGGEDAVGAQANYTTPTCAVPRNDPAVQVMQPSPEQVEWAAHKAVRGELEHFYRNANWHNNGLDFYTIGEEFPSDSLEGGGRVPAQVLLGILAQESNLWQAQGGALPGVRGSPLTGDYYGTVYGTDDANGRQIIVDFDYTESDCGYGVGQVTDGMRNQTGDPYTADQQTMIATDYVANIAASLQILQDKWDDAYGKDLKANQANPDHIEDWYFAIWGYNSGIYERHGGSLGWTNNPANSDWMFDRQPYMYAGFDDAKTPQYWAYQEKVLSYATRSLWIHGEPTFEGSSGTTRSPLIWENEEPYVDRFAFCEIDINDCDPNFSYPGSEPEEGDQSFCRKINENSPEYRECWWNGPKEWIGPGDQDSGEGTIDLSSSEPPTPRGPYWPSCVIPRDATHMIYTTHGCEQQRSSGTFEFEFGESSSGAPLGSIDLHQLGDVGQGGHIWYAGTNREGRESNRVTGTWSPDLSSLDGKQWFNLQVHIPDVGATTFQADYEIYTSGDSVQPDYHRVVNQRWNENTWVDLGYFELEKGAHVDLSNETYNDFDEFPSQRITIAWDTLALIPSDKPEVSYVAMGDSYSAGEGVEPYYSNSDVGHTSPAKTPGYVNECHRSRHGVSDDEVGAYGTAVFRNLRDAAGGLDATSFYHMTACSGATTRTMLPAVEGGGELGHGEIPQLEQGWLDENTTHVSVSITGNDFGFSDIVKQCAITGWNCQAAIDDALTMEDEIRTRLRNVLGRIEDETEGNADVVLVGYPYLVASQSKATCPIARPGARSSIRSGGQTLAQMLQDVADVTGVIFADPRERFDGHEACTSGGEEWIHAIVGVPPKPASFHPKARGQFEYSVVVSEALGVDTSPK